MTLKLKEELPTPEQWPLQLAPVLGGKISNNWLSSIIDEVDNGDLAVLGSCLSMQPLACL